MFATYWSCLLVRMLLRFAGFHRQRSSGLFRGLLCLEVFKSRSASGIELVIKTFRKLLVYFFVFSFALFIRGQKIFYCSVFSVLTGNSRSMSRRKRCKSSTCATLLRARRLLLQKLGLLASSGFYTLRDIEPRCAACWQMYENET